MNAALNRADLVDYAWSLIELYEPDPNQSRQLIECIRQLIAELEKESQ